MQHGFVSRRLHSLTHLCARSEAACWAAAVANMVSHTLPAQESKPADAQQQELTTLKERAQQMTNRMGQMEQKVGPGHNLQTMSLCVFSSGGTAAARLARLCSEWSHV